MFVAWVTSTETLKSTVKGVWEGLKARGAGKPVRGEEDARALLGHAVHVV
jgi:hypothetical protein